MRQMIESEVDKRVVLRWMCVQDYCDWRGDGQVKPKAVLQLLLLERASQTDTPVQSCDSDPHEA